LKRIIFLCIVTCLFSTSIHSKTIKYAPLPMYRSELVLKQYQGMLDYLSSETGYRFEFAYYADYEHLLDALVEAKVDIAHLGPLPYAVLLNRENHNTKPIVQFLDSKGKATYTCSLITHQKNFFKDGEMIFEPIALTQPLSTCGFLSVAHLLKKYNLNLSELNYHYSGTHSNVVLDILLGDASIGGVRSSEYAAYKHLKLKEIDKTQPLPWIFVGRFFKS